MIQLIDKPSIFAAKKQILQGFSEILKSRIPRTVENLGEKFQLTLRKTGT